MGEVDQQLLSGDARVIRIEDSGSDEGEDYVGPPPDFRANTAAIFKTNYKQNGWYLWPVVITAAFGRFIQGFDLGIVSGVLVPIENEFSLSQMQVQSFVSSVMIVGALGSTIAGYLADMIGRKGGLVFALVTISFGSAVMVLSTTFEMLMAARCIVGIGLGSLIVIPAMYCAEIAPAESRGTMTMLNANLYVAGPPIGYVVSLFCQNNWRLAVATVALLGVAATAALLLVVPPSPRFLLSNGEEAECAAIVRKTVDPNERDRESIVSEVLLEMKFDMQRKIASLYEVLFSKDNQDVLIVGVSFSMFCQLVGVDPIFYYLQFTLPFFGISPKDAILLGVIMSALNGGLTFVVGYIVDNPKVGRRWPLMIGSIGVLLSLLAISGTAYSVKYGHFDLATTRKMAIASFLAFAVFYGVGYGPLGLLVPSEMFSGSFRSKSLGICGLLSRLCAFSMSFSYLSMNETLSMGGTFLIYSVVSLFAVVFCYICIPEMTGLTIGSRAPSSVFGRSASARFDAKEAEGSAPLLSDKNTHTHKKAAVAGPGSSSTVAKLPGGGRCVDRGRQKRKANLYAALVRKRL